jgi:peptidoglycan/LPS O-acetylase OafA/YrhL
VRWTFVFWGLLMAVIAVVGVIAFGFDDPEEPALFGSTVATMMILGGVVWMRRWDRVDEEYLRAHPDISPPIPWIGVSIGLLAYSLEVGWWLSLIAGGMIVFGLGGLVRERRAARAALRRGVAQETWEGRRPL